MLIWDVLISKGFAAHLTVMTWLVLGCSWLVSNELLLLISGQFKLYLQMRKEKMLLTFSKIAIQLTRNAMKHLGQSFFLPLWPNIFHLVYHVPSDHVLFCPLNRSEQILFWQASQLLQTAVALWAIARACVSLCVCETQGKQNKIQTLRYCVCLP